VALSLEELFKVKMKKAAGSEGGGVVQYLFICVCAGTISLEIFQPSCPALSFRGEEGGFRIHTLPIYIHPKNLFIHSALCRSLFVEIHSYRYKSTPDSRLT
jgi:hypothetical protein